ncbi:MAG TPA: hypothetical protein VJM53_00965 [Burkholderiales bacterium]|jgi:hypothetical protein|nr:hypothetical protein [Burkholderiales bacterium]
MARYKIACAGLVTLLALSGCEPIVVKSRGERTHANPADNFVEYECVQSPSGKCHFVLFSRSCASAAPEPGTAVETCTTKTIARFSLDVGHKKTVPALPESYEECHSPSDKLIVPDCAKDKVLN